MYQKVIFPLLIVFFCFCSCETSDDVDDENNIHLEELVTTAGINDNLFDKATVFGNALTANHTKPANVYIYDRLTVEKYPGEDGAKKLAARIILLGYTDVLLSVHPSGGAPFAELKNKSWVQTFNKYLHKHNINVHALMFSEASQFNENNNNLIYNHASVIQQFNRTVAPDERFAGASADWEPHALKINSSLSGPEGADLNTEDCWDESRYGKNGANDRLMKRTGEMLEIAKNDLDKLSDTYNLPKIPLNQAINPFFQEKYNNGEMLYSDVSNYLKANRCQDINVMAYNQQKEEVWRRGEMILAAADKNNYANRVYICIKTRLGDDEGPGTSLKPKGWDYLVETLEYIHKQAATYKSMKGISVYDYSDTEDLWLSSN